MTRRKKLIGIIGIALSFLGLAIFNGLVGNTAHEFFWKTLCPLFGKLVSDQIGSVLVVLNMLVTLSCLIVIDHYRKALHRASKIIQLDDRFFRLLPKLRASNHNARPQLVKDLCKDILDSFEALEHCGLAIYRPAPKEPNYLTIWEAYGSPVESGEYIRFFVGHDGQDIRQRGVAGQTFIDQKPRVTHVWLKDGEFHSNSPYFVVFRPDVRHNLMSYRSFITSPLIGQDNQSLGIVCLYSKNQAAFDSQHVQELVGTLSSRLSDVVMACLVNPKKRWPF
jgi:GAF domain-containing protein